MTFLTLVFYQKINFIIDDDLMKIVLIKIHLEKNLNQVSYVIVYIIYLDYINSEYSISDLELKRSKESNIFQN